MGQCLKCSNKTDGTNVFCGSCLSVMEQYPVKTGAVAHIPARPAAPVLRATPNPSAALNALIDRQRKLLRWLAGITALLSVLLIITAAMLIQTLQKDQATRPTIGRNYTTSQQP